MTTKTNTALESKLAHSRAILDEIGKLKDGWHKCFSVEEGRAIPKCVLDAAYKVVKFLLGDLSWRDDHLYIYPMPEGGVQIEWEYMQKVDAEISITLHSKTLMVTWCHRERPFDAGDSDYVVQIMPYKEFNKPAFIESLTNAALWRDPKGV